MNWLDMLDPQKRKAMELAQMQQMQQMGIPAMLQQQAPGYGVMAQPPMPMQQGQPGYGVLAPQANTAQNQAAASGAQGPDVAGLLQMAASIYGQGGQGENAPPTAPPPPPMPVGKSKEGLPMGGRSQMAIERKRKYRRQ